MALIEGLRIQNYRSLRDISMGRIGTDSTLRSADPLSPLTVVIGKNGVGKSSIFDAFGFLADCMETDLETACNARNRGGYDKLISSGIDQSITITIYYRESKNDRPITYEVSVATIRRVSDDSIVRFLWDIPPVQPWFTPFWLRCRPTATRAYSAWASVRI